MRSLSPKRKAALIESLLWLGFCLGAYALTFGFDGPLPVYEFGAAHWPRMVLLGMFIATAWILYSEVWKERDSPPAAEIEDKSEDQDEDTPFLKLETRSQVRMVLIFALPIIYTLLIHKLGFLLVTPFFLFAYMMLMGVRRLRTLLLVSISVYVGLIVVFVKLVFTYLPQGAGVFHQINGIILGWII